MPRARITPWCPPNWMTPPKAPRQFFDQAAPLKYA